MLNIVRPSPLVFAALVAVPLAVLLGACSKAEAPTTPSAMTASPSASNTPAATVPPPPGDSTPKAIDSNAAPVMPESSPTKDAGSGQSATGTAASGLPPYSVGGAPEGNPAPGQGAKDGAKAPSK